MVTQRNGNGHRIQTTVNISQTALDDLARLSNDSMVSRSKLVDLALRRFIRWAQGVSAKELKLIVDYEVSEQTGALRHRKHSSLPPSMAEPEYEERERLPPMPIVKAPRVTEQPGQVNPSRRRNRGGRYE